MMKDILTALRDSAQIHQLKLLQLTKQFNLTIAEWKLLHNVVSGLNTQEALAEQTHLDVSTLSRQLKKLIEKQMIVKTVIGDDKRQLRYRGTDEGIKIDQKVTQLKEQLTNVIFDHWNDEELKLLKILINRLDKSLSRI